MSDKTATANLRLSQLGAIADRLVHLLAEENKALAQGRAADIAASLDDKTALTTAYESAVRAIGKTPGVLAGTERTLRDQVKAAGDRLAATAGENARLLRAHQATHQRVLEIIAEEMRAQAPGQVYSRSGKMGQSPEPLRLAVDRTL